MYHPTLQPLPARRHRRPRIRAGCGRASRTGRGRPPRRPARTWSAGRPAGRARPAPGRLSCRCWTRCSRPGSRRSITASRAPAGHWQRSPDPRLTRSPPIHHGPSARLHAGAVTDADRYRLAFLDWLACAARGRLEPSARAAHTATEGLAGRAMAAGCAGHVLDYDDTYAAGIVHASAPVAPVALLLAAERGLSLAAAVEAYAAGFEATAALARASHPALYERGWHPTSVCGVAGAAVAAARLLGLERSGSASPSAWRCWARAGCRRRSAPTRRRSRSGTPRRPGRGGTAVRGRGERFAGRRRDRLRVGSL